MTHKTLTVAVASILSTLVDTESDPSGMGGAPGGYLAAACMSLPDCDYMAVQATLVAAGLVTVDGAYVVRLTDKGRELGVKCNAVLAAESRK
jgi:hypothetical protein